MLRTFASAFICLTLLLSPPARAADMKEALATLPADAMAVVCVPSVKQLDADYQQALKDLGLTEMIQPPMNSIVAMIKQNLPMFEGMDESGTLAIVMLPADNVMMLDKNTAFVVPAQDPAALATALGGTAAEGGIWSVNVMGQPAFAMAGEKRLIVAQNADAARKIAESKGLAAKLAPAELAAMENLDLAIWIDADNLFKLVKPQLDGFMAMMMMAQSGSGPLGAKQAEATKKQIDTFINGLNSLTLGAALGKPGLGLRAAMNIKPGSDLAKQSKVKSTSESLLRGLPGDKYMMAFGQNADPAALKASTEALDPYFGMLESMEGMDKAMVGQLKNIVDEMIPLMTGLRGMVESLSGSDGLFGVSLIVDTTDSKKFIDAAGKGVETAKKLVTGSTSDKVDDEAKQAVEAITFNADAEKIGGASVAHLKFDVSKIEEVDEESLEEMNKVMGKDLFLVRMAAVDAGKVAITFGGGSGHAARLIESAKSSDAPLEADQGIKKVAPHLPAERYAVFYVAVDQVIAGINKVMKATDEEELPVQFPVINAPLAMVATGSENFTRGELFFPIELLTAVKNATMAMMGGGGAPPTDEAN